MHCTYIRLLYFFLDTVREIPPVPWNCLSIFIFFEKTIPAVGGGVELVERRASCETHDTWDNQVRASRRIEQRYQVTRFSQNRFCTVGAPQYR